MRNQNLPNAPGSSNPLISVIVLNYNGARWLSRCLGSLAAQTIFSRIEVIVADNQSPDGSDRLAAELMRDWASARVIQHGANLGYCEGNNRAARAARGRFLFFLNNDTWLEPDCLERLSEAVEATGAVAATPLMLNYDDDTVQSPGGGGFDPFGFLSLNTDYTATREVFVVGGCSYFIAREVFERLGGFDPAFYMYADEYDLSWRLWVSGGRAILVPGARLHHWGGAGVNATGTDRPRVLRTSIAKRYYSNRNGLVMLLKNGQHVLLLLVPLQLVWLALEAGMVWVWLRQWPLVRDGYIKAVTDCWSLRAHIAAERRRLNALRQRSDWYLLRFWRLRLNRWDEFRRLRRLGRPVVVSQ